MPPCRKNRQRGTFHLQQPSEKSLGSLLLLLLWSCLTLAVVGLHPDVVLKPPPCHYLASPSSVIVVSVRVPLGIP